MPSFLAKDLSAWSGGTWERGEPPPVRGICADTRTLRAGELYVALRGPHFDGHTFIGEAFARGAAAVMAETAVESAGKPVLRVPCTRKALAALAAGYRRTLDARLIGVTGSVGKSTVKEMTADLLASAAPTARTRGNWNNDIGLPLSLLMIEPSDRYGVFEVGTNHPGEIVALCEYLRPEWGIITAIGPAHLEYFDSVESIAREKSALLRILPAKGLAFLSRDDAWFDRLRAASPCEVVTVSLDAEADYRAQPDPAAGSRFVVQERATGQRAELTAPLPGRYMVANALLAVAVGRRCGLTWEAIRESLGRYRPLPMRWNRAVLHGVEFVNDAYNSNPVSVRAALETFAKMEVAGRRWLVLGGMLELGAAECDLHHQLGRDVAAGPWAGLLYVGPRGAWIAEGAREAGMSADRLFGCPDTMSAAGLLNKLARPGDAVLLKASRTECLEKVQEAYAASQAAGQF
ncbi:MAG: UDP-N-acetylmuramoyl-tripeptide--D-alanyl-D-alanine ligase [Verrucomicrobia bacterium]|nr:UDP-N-acetylmuramoyl-tripeptide--D-alanyl-D-alanine ligase [Verrucomicrobiota bacterium]